MAGNGLGSTVIPGTSSLGKHLTETVARCRQQTNVLLFQGSKKLRYRLGGDDADWHSVVKGYFAHAGLAVAPDGRLLGALFSLPWATDPDLAPNWEGRNLASLPQYGHDMASKLVAHCPNSHIHLIWDIADGLYDLFERHASAGQAFNLLVRATRARKIRIESPITGRPVQAVGHLAAEPPVMRDCRLEVGEGRNTQGRDVRVTQVSLRSGTVGLLAPAARGRCEPVPVTAIWVTENDPPPKRRTLEWLLLSSARDLDAAAIRNCLSHYEQRWTFDEFFRVLNDGSRMEHRDICDYYGYLRPTHELESRLASDSVHACKVLNLRRLMHVTPRLPAEQAIDPTKLACLYHALRRNSGTQAEPKRGGPPTKDIRAVVIDIGRLGGFLYSRRRVLPSRQAVWRGYRRLRTMARALELARA